jgi:hypothetical protein
MFRQNCQQNEARKYTANDWEDMRPNIARLYDSGTLESVIRSMREEYGFEATPKQYKDRIRKWGLNKNIQQDEMEAMIRKRQERESESNKKTAFRIRGRPVDEEKIERYMRDHPKQLPINDHIDMDIDRNMSLADTPAGIIYYTPSDTEPLAQKESPSLLTSLRPCSDVGPQNSNGYVTGNPNDLPTTYKGTCGSPGAPQDMPEYLGSGYHKKYRGLAQPSCIPPHGSYDAPQQYSSPYPPPPPQGPQSFQETRSFGSDAPQGYTFQYSNCTGRRKALLIGINYFGQRGQLRGCINDVNNISSFLRENIGYKRDDIVILTDNQQNPISQPTKQNILRGMHWLVKDAMPNDSLFFHYSGHGGQIKDLDNNKENGYDEVIYPVDFRKFGHIVDYEIHRIMVMPLETGVRLTAIFDSCHSGTALDLPYIYSTQGVLKQPNLSKEAGQGFLGVISSYSQGDLGGIASNLMSFFKKVTTGDDSYNKTIATKTSPADVIMWSISKDEQTSLVYPF